ncbi:juvenile hormone acid O-methyltransferase-like [Diorhabda carinulata]|uniref:juvenile hormone acid O-methyltransferase-like n=1 Tax=Diorhabda carinulata TaxID=1163345 RepID=UPI0025A208E8|nr:juvenile hormone acid O-methyltransferase-like [Diorhabda carinulata]
MGMVLPELFAKSSQVTAAILSKAMNKHKDMIVWRKKPSILEFGFADGHSSKVHLRPLIPPDYHEFIGTDISPSMVEYAKKNVSIPRSKFYELDIATKNLPEMFCNRFDNVFSFLSMHMVLDPRQGFTNVFKMLKEGGQTFHIFFEKIPSDGIFETLSKHPKWGKYGQEKMLSAYYDKANPREFYENDLRAAGFKDIKFEVDRNLAHEYDSAQELRDLSISINKSIAYVPEEELEEYKEKYMQEVYDQCVARTPDNKIVEPLTVKFTLYTVCAQKH